MAEGQVAHFIQENVTPVGGLEASQAGAVRSGKGSFHVAEELAFQQRFVQGGAVYLDKRPLLDGDPGRCSARATSSLPVPLSPQMMTGASDWATLAMSEKSCSITGDLPTIP